MLLIFILIYNLFFMEGLELVTDHEALQMRVISLNYIKPSLTLQSDGDKLGYLIVLLDVLISFLEEGRQHQT